jgi:HSP20 family protein
MAKGAEEKAVAPKKPSEVVSRGEEFEHWLDRLNGRHGRRHSPSLFGRDRWLPFCPLSIRMPSLDVYEEKDTVVVKAELPGMKKEDIEVNLTGETLTIKGRKSRKKKSRRTIIIAGSVRMDHFSAASNCPAR